MANIGKGCLGCFGAAVVGVIVLIIIGVAFGGNSTQPTKVSNSDSESVSNDTDQKSEEPTEEAKETVFKKGETAELNGVQVTLLDYKESDGSEFNKPSDGNVFLLVEFEIANNTDDELTVSSMASFEAYADDYSLNYSLNALIENKETQLDGSIAPGKKIKGWIGWEVPKDYKEVEIHYTDNVWFGNKFIFLIEN